MHQFRRRLCAGVILSLASLALHAEELPKTAYPGQIADGAELQALSKGRDWKYEIQGGFSSKALLANYSVGDTIDMQFHVGIVGIPLKLSTKSFPAPEPTLHLVKDGEEIQTIKFTKGAC